MKRLLALILILAVGAGAGWYFFSPKWTLSQMREAAKAGDTAKLAEYVDYDALKSDLDVAISKALIGTPKKETGVIGTLKNWGNDLGSAYAERVAGHVATPKGVQSLFAGQSMDETASGSPEVLDTSTPFGGIGVSGRQSEIEHLGLSQFKVLDTTNHSALIFTRHGLGWKFSGVVLPPDANLF